MSVSGISRRRMLALSSATVGAFLLRGPARSQLASLAAATGGDPVQAELGPPDSLGVRVPVGFSTSLVGLTGERVGSTSMIWHGDPDGGACFAVPGSSDHVYVSNAEIGGGAGGVSAVRLDSSGVIVDAYPILEGTSRNCAGGATPWDTWLSCEEHSTGWVWECDPFGGPAAAVPALGTFRHEAVAVDAVRRQLFLTEDRTDGRLYRFTPAEWPDLSKGRLEAAAVTDSVISWVAVGDDRPERSSATTAFDGGEGIVIDGDWMAFATKGDRRVWQVDLSTAELSVFHDCRAQPETALTHVDNLALHPVTRHLFVAEDGGDNELCMLTRGDSAPVVSPVVRFEGHDGSEVAGPAFSPDGTALYVSSQRGADGRGMTVRIAGPWDRWLGSIDGPAIARTPAVRLGVER